MGAGWIASPNITLLSGVSPLVPIRRAGHHALDALIPQRYLPCVAADEGRDVDALHIELILGPGDFQDYSNGVALLVGIDTALSVFLLFAGGDLPKNPVMMGFLTWRYPVPPRM
jgi:hypothetical protein